MNRSRSIPPLALLSLLLLSACGRSDGPADVLVITVDTLRADRLGCYGNGSGLTPNLDALASIATLFEDASAPVPITLPSHTSMFTGRYPTATGVRNNGTFVVPDSEWTLAEALAEAGWDTAAVVASFPLHSRFGLNQGFRVYDEAFPAPSPGTGPTVFFSERNADAVTDRALAVWRNLEGPGRFLWVHYFDPHAPYEPPPEYAARAVDRPYDGEVAYVDAAIGRLLEEIASGSGRLLTVVTSDHGEGLGDHGEKTHGVFLYQSTLQVPLIIRWPDGDLAGERVADPVSLVDLFSTVLAAVGLDGEGESTDGADLRRVADGTLDPDRPVYAESFLARYEYRFSELRALRSGPLKLIDAPEPELYDLSRDPVEHVNLAGDRREQRDLEARLVEIVAREDSDASARATRGMDRETAERLRSLGYLAGGGNEQPAPGQTARDPKEMTGYMGRYDRAIGLIAGRRTEEGIALLRQLREEAPENYLVDLQIGAAHLAAGRPADARTFLERVVEQAPEHYPALLMLAEVLGLQGHLEPAEARYREAAELAPWSGEPWFQLGGFLRASGRFAEAAAALREAVSREPGSREYAAALTDLRIVRGDLDVSVREWLEFVAAHRDSAAVREECARVHLLRDSPDVAEREALEALRIDPVSETAMAHLGDALLATGRTQEALERLLSFEELALPSATLHFAIGRALASAGRFEEADARFGAALRLDPDLADVYLYRGRLLESRDDRAGAAAMYRRVLRIRRDDAEAWEGLQRLRTVP